MNLTSMRLVDLTHRMTLTMPQWPADQVFFHETHRQYHQGVRVTQMHSPTGVGTHVDAPSHFCPKGRDVDQLELKELFCPAVVVDVQAAVVNNEDYAVSVEDLCAWESQYGLIPSGAMVIALTGWYLRWATPITYINATEAGRMHFPGFSLAAAEWLVARDVAGIGIDTLSLDCGVATDFPVHNRILQADKYQIENLTALDQLPAQGAYILTCPMKLQGASEAFARVIGFVVTG